MTLRPLTLIGIILSIVTGISVGVLAHVMTREKTPADSAATLSKAMRQVSQNYVEEISEAELLGHAIDGMMGAWTTIQATSTKMTSKPCRSVLPGVLAALASSWAWWKVISP